MPLIMDEDMDIDMNDLFGDGADLSIPSRPPPKELYQRIDELRGSGACQGLAWSRSGSIASILPGGNGLQFRSLRCHPYDGQWELNESTDFPKMNSSGEGGPIKHLSWSPVGSDLAVIDSCGRVSIFTMTTSLNKPNIAKNSLSGAAEDLNAVVGTYWTIPMPVQRAPAIYPESIKVDGEYRCNVIPLSIFGPYHPNSTKPALVCMTTNGILRLIWTQNNGAWHETTHEIDNLVSSNDLITHAAICADKGHNLLMAYATVSKQLRTVRINIDWGYKKPPDKAPMSNPASIHVDPSIIVSHLAVVDLMDVQSVEESGFGAQSSVSTLSHVVFLPPDGQSSLPTLMTVRSFLPASPSQFNQNVESIINRWELREAVQTVHSAFRQQSSGNKKAGSESFTITVLKKLEGFSVNKIAISVESAFFDRLICFGYSDGTLEYRDRSSITDRYSNDTMERFSHISRIGFSYSDEEPCLQTAMSPTTCSFVQTGVDGKTKWKYLQHQLEDMGRSQDDEQFPAALAGLAMSFSNAIMLNENYDDLLGLMHKYAKINSFSRDVASRIFGIMKFQVDYSEESHHDILIRNPAVQIGMTFKTSLGYHGNLHPRSFGGRFAWLTLQIRNCVVLMSIANFTARVPMAGHDGGAAKVSAGLEEPDVIRILSGSVRWCLDLFSWIVDSLLNPDMTNLFDAINSNKPIQQTDLDILNARLRSSNNIALHLLLSSATRGYLTAICRRLSHLDYTTRKSLAAAAAQSQTEPSAPQPLISPALRDAYKHIATLTSGSIIRDRHFEPFLTSLAAEVKEAYSNAGYPPQASTYPGAQNPQIRPPQTPSPRNELEQGILFGGPIPYAFAPVLTSLFSTLLPSLKSNIDTARLFFYDFGILGLDPSPTEEGEIEGNARVDAGAGAETTESGTATGKEVSKKAKAKAGRYTIDIFQRVPLDLGKPPRGSASASASASALAKSGQQQMNGNGNGNGEKAPLATTQDRKGYRRCLRCAAVMEEVSSTKQPVLMLIMQQRRCSCQGYWVIMDGGEILI